MKNKVFKVILALVFMSIYAKVDAQSIFQGVWEYQNGNEIFRVILSEHSDQNDIIQGHYEKVSVNSNGDESFIYSSDKEKFQGQNTGWVPFAINLKEIESSLSGTVIDNTVDQSLYSPIKSGQLKIQIISNSGGNNPVITASWRIQRDEGIEVNESPNYNIPVNIVLRKISD